MDRASLLARAQPIRFTSLLGSYIRQFGPSIKTKGDLIRLQMLFAGRIKRRLSHLEKMRPGAARAHSIHKMIDAAIAKRDREVKDTDKISCRKGCSHCCHMFVTCTDDEAALLLEVVKKRNIPLDEERLERQAGLDDDGFMTLSYEDAACVFLKDGVCQVYEDRPTACRNLRVSSSPFMCIPRPENTYQVACVVVPEAEIIASASLNLEGGMDMVSSLSTKLWRHLAPRTEGNDCKEARSGREGQQPEARL